MYRILNKHQNTDRRLDNILELQFMQNIEELGMWKQKTTFLILQRCHFMFQIVEDIKQKLNVSDTELWESLKTNVIPEKLTQANISRLTHNGTTANTTEYLKLDKRAEKLALENIGYRGTQPYKIVLGALCLFSSPKVVKAGSFAQSMALASHIDAVANALSDEGPFEHIQEAGMWTAIDKMGKGEQLDVADQMHIGVSALNLVLHIGKKASELAALLSED